MVTVLNVLGDRITYQWKGLHYSMMMMDKPVELLLLRSTRWYVLSRHFLFKPGGTSPMYCTTSPGYPLTSSTVYSPPPRPLPRNTFSRPAFSLKKPYKHCNWKCAALSAILISVTLLFLLAYFIGESPLMLLHMGDVHLHLHAPENSTSPI